MSTPPKSDLEPELRPHTYDGIQEYDQKLPNWWLFTLYIAIVFSIAAWLSYYQLGIGMSDEDRMDAFITARQANADKKLAGITDDELSRAYAGLVEGLDATGS